MQVQSDPSQAAGQETPCPRNLVLVGFMGCGKTTVARHLAQNCGLRYVDLDEMVVEQAGGRSIPELFKTEGEAGFRRRESAALRSLLGRQGLVVATGGGVVGSDDNLQLLRNLGFVVWLDASMEDMWRRVCANSNRPMLHVADPRGEAERLWRERLPRYRKAAHLRIETEGLSADEVACGVSASAALHFARSGAGMAPCDSDPGSGGAS